MRDQVTGDWPLIPYIEQGESGAYLKSLGLKDPSDASPGESLSFPLPPDREDYTEDYSTDDVLLNRPLQRLAPIFRAADLVMVNNEGALSDHGRQVGLNRTPERFAISMRDAGISLVNLANNHTFDAEERGFLDTLRALSLAGIAHVGGGVDLADARKALQKGDLRAAQIYLRNAVRSDPQNAEAHFWLARVSLELGDAVASEREVRAARDRGFEVAREMLCWARTEMAGAYLIPPFKRYEEVLEVL